METDQAEQLDAPLDQSTKTLNKNQEAEEIDTLMTSKGDNRPPSLFNNQDALMMF